MNAYGSSYDSTVNISFEIANDFEREILSDIVTLLVEKAVNELNENILIDGSEEDVLALCNLAASIKEGIKKVDDLIAKAAEQEKKQEVQDE